MLSHVGKEEREVYKMLPWMTEGDAKKFNKVIAAFKAYCKPQKMPALHPTKTMLTAYGGTMIKPLGT